MTAAVHQLGSCRQAGSRGVAERLDGALQALAVISWSRPILPVVGTALRICASTWLKCTCIASRRRSKCVQMVHRSPASRHAYGLSQG